MCSWRSGSPGRMEDRRQLRPERIPIRGRETSRTVVASSDPNQIGLTSVDRRGDPAAGVVVGPIGLVIGSPSRSRTGAEELLALPVGADPWEGIPSSGPKCPGPRSRRNAISHKSRFWRSRYRRAGTERLDGCLGCHLNACPKLTDFPGCDVSRPSHRPLDGERISFEITNPRSCGRVSGAGVYG